MKKLLYIFILFISFICFSQTPITNSNIHDAVDLWESNQTSAEAQFGHISNWNTSDVNDMSVLFNYAISFNEPIGNWDVSNVTDMSGMFTNASIFNQDISNWNVSSVTDMASMFKSALIFNQDISNWNVSSVTDMTSMFWIADSFNQDIGSWDVSNVTDMTRMFCNTSSFNQPIGNWDVGNVVHMLEMFQASEFNQPIGNWDVSKVESMRFLFNQSPFNQDISNWDVSSVYTMKGMFRYSCFNQDIGNWDITFVSSWSTAAESMENMFDNTEYNINTNCGMSTVNYDNILIAWSQQNVAGYVNFGVDLLNYCNGEAARQILIENYNWIFNGDSYDCSNLSLDENILYTSIYPNPASNYVYVNSDKDLEVIVFNLLGQQVIREFLADKIDISCLEKGTYIINLIDGINTSSHKIIKN